ncbi:hypothetical protein AMJ47_01280 [Parcubacteria bacterium DG_72]|nr:MAG: hypothetical protein AMJ47_01280 [Parcubacteria bacterium DG_72]
MKDSDIIKSIKNKKKISFIYKNEGTRIVSPHVLYFNPRNEKMFDAFQYKGYSEHGGLPNWRQFFLEHATDIRTLDEGFEIEAGYNPISSRYVNSICKL